MRTRWSSWHCPGGPFAASLATVAIHCVDSPCTKEETQGENPADATVPDPRRSCPRHWNIACQARPISP